MAKHIRSAINYALFVWAKKYRRSIDCVVWIAGVLGVMFIPAPFNVFAFYVAMAWQFHDGMLAGAAIGDKTVRRMLDRFENIPPGQSMRLEFDNTHITVMNSDDFEFLLNRCGMRLRDVAPGESSYTYTPPPPRGDSK